MAVLLRSNKHEVKSFENPPEHNLIYLISDPLHARRHALHVIEEML